MEQMQYLYLKYRNVMMNAVLLCAILFAIQGKNDTVRSLSLGLASGIALVQLGESINRLKSRGTKQVSQ
jgi:hypothetical protein